MKTLKIILIIIVLVILFFMILRFGSEDSWIKDDKGIWIKHGNPSDIPSYVSEQQEAVTCAFSLYDSEKEKGIEFKSQCLGDCGEYAVDIVNVPRNQEDNLEENQCQEYREGKVSKFIEIDKERSIVRII